MHSSVIRIRRIAPAALVAVALVALVGCNPGGTPLDRSRAVFAAPGCQVGVVGDSLLVGARDYGALAQKFAARGCQVTSIDARVGRGTAEGAAIVEHWAALGFLPRVLVVGLGTNDCDGARFASSARRILAAAGPDRPVVWINVRRLGCDGAINSVLWALQRELAARTDGGNIWILNHLQWVSDNRGVLARDGIHLTADGYRQHADRIAAVVTGT